MKNSKLTARKLLVVILTVVLVTVCVSSSTFSWFKRPASNSGGSVSLAIPYGDKDPNGNSLTMKAYDGNNLSMKSYLSTDDAISFSETAADPATSGTLAPNKRIYYKTDITNSGDTDQKISLFLKNFVPNTSTTATDVNVCVGVNYPIKAFKNYSRYGQVIPPAAKNMANGTVKRIYFEPYNRVPSGNSYDDHRKTWKTNASAYYAVSGTSSTDIDANSGSAATYTKMTQIGSTGVFYADIPVGHNKLYFAVNDWGGTDYKRTQTFTDLNGDGLSTVQSLLFYTNGTYTDYNNAWAGKENVTGASFGSYYSSVTISTGQTVDISLSKGVNYGGSSITYTAKNTASSNLFTVSSAGVITPKAGKSGTGYVVYTITSEKGDKVTKEITVKVQSYSTTSTTIENAPIVTNLTVPANGTETVWWFIQNGDETFSQATDTATYKHEGIFLGV